MKYVGMQTQISRNNRLSLMLLLMFPVIISGMVWVFLATLNYLENGYTNQYGESVHYLNVDNVNQSYLTVIPWIALGVAVWFIIAYFYNASIIQHATGAHAVTRMENPRLYNIVENLCMTCNMDMPKINIVDDPQLNAYASGINAQSYTVTVTEGLLNKLNDDELAAVLGHELTHIRNHDTKLLITCIVFVGIVSTVMSIAVRILYNTLLYGGERKRDDEKGGSGLGIIIVLLIGIICCAIAYVFTLLTRFAISRKREYMADAGGAELCGNPLALASALRKISADPGLDNVKRPDVAQLFIAQPDGMKHGLMSFMDSLFSTHPDVKKRIALLEQF